jgi:metal-responsive CopG/Arc/MetJ family transcriptional regulator
MHRTNIYLDQRQCATLDRLAAEEGTSRAELIRRVLDGWLEGKDRDSDGDLEAIDASFGVLSDLEATKRRPDEREDHLARMWRIRG